MKRINTTFRISAQETLSVVGIPFDELLPNQIVKTVQDPEDRVTWRNAGILHIATDEGVATIVYKFQMCIRGISDFFNRTFRGKIITFTEVPGDVTTVMRPIVEKTCK